MELNPVKQVGFLVAIGEFERKGRLVVFPAVIMSAIFTVHAGSIGVALSALGSGVLHEVQVLFLITHLSKQSS